MQDLYHQPYGEMPQESWENRETNEAKSEARWNKLWGLLKGSWDLATRVRNKVTIPATAYNPN